MLKSEGRNQLILGTGRSEKMKRIYGRAVCGCGRPRTINF